MFSQKETIREDQSEARSQRIALGESSSEKLENAFLELKKEHVKLTRSQLASEAVVFYFDRCFGKERRNIATKYFNTQSFLKEKIDTATSKEDMEKVLQAALIKSRKGKRYK